MKLLLDTHFVLWIVTESNRLRRFSWLEAHRPWGVSPVSLLEMQFLHEVGRVEVDQPAFLEALRRDRRFVVDDPSLLTIAKKAMSVSWTRDPFDRLLAAHSDARRTPLCTVDRTIRQHHRTLLPEPDVGPLTSFEPVGG